MAPMVISAAVFALALRATQLVIDVDGDGRPDTVSLIQERNAAVVLVRFAARRHSAQRFRFVVDPGREDAICKLPAQLRAEPRGFALVDGACDSIHFRWDPKTHRIVWWRL